jgi:hypothetical protein
MSKMNLAKISMSEIIIVLCVWVAKLQEDDVPSMNSWIVVMVKKWRWHISFNLFKKICISNIFFLSCFEFTIVLKIQTLWYFYKCLKCF